MFLIFSKKELVSLTGGFCRLHLRAWLQRRLRGYFYGDTFRFVHPHSPSRGSTLELYEQVAIVGPGPENDPGAVQPVLSCLGLYLRATLDPRGSGLCRRISSRVNGFSPTGTAPVSLHPLATLSDLPSIADQVFAATLGACHRCFACHFRSLFNYRDFSHRNREPAQVIEGDNRALRRAISDASHDSGAVS